MISAKHGSLRINSCGSIIPARLLYLVAVAVPTAEQYFRNGTAMHFSPMYAVSVAVRFGVVACARLMLRRYVGIGAVGLLLVKILSGLRTER